MRAFIAVELSPAARESIAKVQAEWKASLPAARWVPPENLHLTLRFLGDIEPDVASALAETLRPAVLDVEPFTYSVRGGGCFPNVKRARIAWVGIQPVPDGLVHLHRIVDEAVERHGFERETRRFRPHLTIARLKRPVRQVRDIMAALDAKDFGNTDVSELVLFESTLSSEGAKHHAVERFQLGGSRREQLV